MKESLLIAILGTRALLITCNQCKAETAYKNLSSLAHQIGKYGLEDHVDSVISYDSLVLHFKSTITSIARTKNDINNLYNETEIKPYIGVKHYIPVCYEEEYGLDLNILSEGLKLAVEQLIQVHFNKEYMVYMIGFLPGFPYLGYVDSAIAYPRKSHPRNRVLKGSIGIAGNQTGIYPQESPGGWNIIGNSPVSLKTKDNKRPFLFSPGDRVKFYPISRELYEYLSYE